MLQTAGQIDAPHEDEKIKDHPKPKVKRDSYKRCISQRHKTTAGHQSWQSEANENEKSLGSKVDGPRPVHIANPADPHVAMNETED
jgi:hypothetical protein